MTSRTWTMDLDDAGRLAGLDQLHADRPDARIAEDLLADAHRVDDEPAGRPAGRGAERHRVDGKGAEWSSIVSQP
jgi:hypothetical protein